MTDDTKNRGIHDPWRVGVPAPVEENAPVGAQGSPDDMDWDLVPHKQYVLRVGGAALKVIGVDNPVNAAFHLIDVYKKDARLRGVLQEVGFTDEHSLENATGMVLRAGTHVLCCPSALSNEEGLRRMTCALRAAIRKDPTMQKHLNHLGLVPLVE